MQSEGILHSFGEILFSLAIFVRTFFQALGLLPAPCEQPIQYTLGVIDDRFGISESEVLEALSQAEALWERDSGKDLFVYNKEGGLPVQFVYDERQQKTEARQDLEAKLNGLQLEKSESETKKQIARYEAAKVDYEQKRSAYDAAAKRYNQRVTDINERGGATPEQQEELEDDYDDLQEQYQALERARQEVNSLAGAANEHIAANRTLVEAYNKEVTTFQDRYGGEGEIFDQGVYTGSDITIYQYDDLPRLVLVLAHEMGHALGIDHVEEPGALMYYLMRDQDIKNITLHEADQEALTNICQPPKFPWQR